MHIDAIVASAAALPGWMSTEELRYLAEMAARHERIAEIGSWQGRSTKALALATHGVVYSIDDFRGEVGTPSNPGHMAPGQLEIAYRENLKGELATGKVVHARMASVQAAIQMQRWYRTFSLVFVDGSHDLTSVILDIAYWQPLVEPGGILAGHDWGVGQVKEALELVLPEARQVTGTIWEWRAPE